jgi:phosphoglycerate kinase
MTRYLTLDDVDVDGAKVLVRSDLNVPIEEGEVTDDFRIRSALPTLERLVAAGADVTVCSHLGRPKGPDPSLSLRPVAERMAEMTINHVGFETGGAITVLENTRFLAGETENDAATARDLADGFDLFVQDAFGSVHRAHASTVGVAEIVESAAGPLLDAELKALSRFLGDTERPFTVVLAEPRCPTSWAWCVTCFPAWTGSWSGVGCVSPSWSPRGTVWGNPWFRKTWSTRWGV